MICDIIIENDPYIGTKSLEGIPAGICCINGENSIEFISRLRDYIELIRRDRKLPWPEECKTGCSFLISWKSESYPTYGYRIAFNSNGKIVSEKLLYKKWSTTKNFSQLCSLSYGLLKFNGDWYENKFSDVEFVVKNLGGIVEHDTPILPSIDSIRQIMLKGFRNDLLSIPIKLHRKIRKSVDQRLMKDHLKEILGEDVKQEWIEKIVPYIMRTTILTGTFIDPGYSSGLDDEILTKFVKTLRETSYSAQIIIGSCIPEAIKVQLK